MGLHVIITGNPCSGFEIIGPFATMDEAIEWADRTRFEDDWWISPLKAQAEYGSDSE